MRNTITPFILLLISSMALAQNASTYMYIVPVDASGEVKFNEENQEYPDKMEMTANEDGTFSISSVAIYFGFYFLGNNDKDGTLYAMNSWAVIPPVEIGPNPLIITTHKAKNFIPVNEGIYDITFIPKNVSGAKCMLFTIKNSESESMLYPDVIFLSNGTSDNQNIEIQGSDGVFYFDLPSNHGSFSISYEPRNDYPSFIYGSKNRDDNKLEPGKRVVIQRDMNTTTPFTYDIQSELPTTVTISLVRGNEYVEFNNIITTGINDVTREGVITDEGNSSSDEVKYYTLSGIRVKLPYDQLSPGVYISIKDNHATKIFK